MWVRSCLVGCRRWPPGAFLTLPFFGEIFAFMEEGPVDFAFRRAKLFGSLFTMGYIGEPLVSVCSPTDIQRLLLSEGELVERTHPKSCSCQPSLFFVRSPYYNDFLLHH
jgi:hypothetical protein